MAAGSPLLKIKWTHRQEFAIAGYVPLLGTRIGEVGGLILALKSPDGAFHFAGKVGTGFTSAMRAKLGKLLEADHVDESPLVDAPRLTLSNAHVYGRARCIQGERDAAFVSQPPLSPSTSHMRSACR